MHREQKHAAFLVGLVEFVDPHLCHIARIHVRLAAWIEEWGIVENPLHRQLDDARRLTALQQFVRTVVGHQRALVTKAHVAKDAQRIGAEVPAGGAVPRRLDAGHRRQLGHRLRQQRTLGAIGKRGIQFVNPAVYRELVASALADRVGHAWCQGQAHGWNEKRRWYPVSVEQSHQPAKTAPRPVLRRRQRTHGGLAETKRNRLVVHVERQQHSHTRATGPDRRRQ